MSIRVTENELKKYTQRTDEVITKREGESKVLEDKNAITEFKIKTLQEAFKSSK
jgi:hypothetical protein